MLISARKKIILILVTALVLLMSLLVPLAGAYDFSKMTGDVRVETPCPQQKAEQAQKSCRGNNFLQFFSLPSLQLPSRISLADKIKLLFTLGLLAMSPVYFIFKPPKTLLLI